MENFNLSENAIKALNNDINSYWGSTVQETRGNIYEMIAEASIVLAMNVDCEETPSVIPQVNEALHIMKMLVDDIFKE